MLRHQEHTKNKTIRGWALVLEEGGGAVALLDYVWERWPGRAPGKRQLAFMERVKEWLSATGMECVVDPELRMFGWEEFVEDGR